MMHIYSEVKDDFNAFLKNNGVWLAIVIAIVIAITIFLIIFLNRKKKGKRVEISDNTKGDDWLIALGNKENIIESSANGSRLTLKLVDQNKIDKDRLKQLGVSNIVTMSDKIILVLEDKAELIKQKLE